jgi:ParB-like chromosome segregation protein Spo0J
MIGPDVCATIEPHTNVETPERLRLECWPLDRLIPSPRNARTHGDAQVAEIAGSIRSFGFTNPVLVGDSGDVVAGHGRLAAARMLGLTEVPVIVLRGLTEVQRRLRLSDPIALRLDRQSPDRDHDANCIRVWIDAGEQK